MCVRMKNAEMMVNIIAPRYLLRKIFCKNWIFYFKPLFQLMRTFNSCCSSPCSILSFYFSCLQHEIRALQEKEENKRAKTHGKRNISLNIQTTTFIVLSTLFCLHSYSLQCDFVMNAMHHPFFSWYLCPSVWLLFSIHLECGLFTHPMRISLPNKSHIRIRCVFYNSQ